MSEMTSQIKIGDVTVTKVVELDRSSYDVAAMLPESTPERIEAQRHWLGPELLVPGTAVDKARKQRYAGRPPQPRAGIDLSGGEHEPAHGGPACERLLRARN